MSMFKPILNSLYLYDLGTKSNRAKVQEKKQDILNLAARPVKSTYNFIFTSFLPTRRAMVYYGLDLQL